MKESGSFYSYIDTQGVDVIVQSLADVPEQYRAQVKHIDLSKPAITLPSGPGEASKVTPETSVHVPSFFLGAGAATVLGLLGMVAFRKAHRILGVAAAVAVMAALGIGYMTFVRRHAGLRGAGLVTPASLLDDARAAAGALNERHREQEHVLNELDKQR